jgi:LmbE family N-acetylglucosaminyl deacetylase
MKKKLFIAPHPDDEVLGAGGVIKKFSKEGHEVYVLVITRGSPKYYSDEKIQNVRKEALEAHKILGVKQTVFLDFHAPELDITSNADISRAISEYISNWKITDLFIPHRGDIHNDHRKVFEASLVAARPVGNFTVKAIYTYETLSETEWAAPFSDDAFIPNHFENISDTISYKFEAMQCFKSQIRDFPSTRSLETIESLAKFRGSTVGFNRAEAFMIIRTIAG